MLGSVTLRLSARLFAYLLIASCTQSALETYGCACASRTYTTEEIAGYRALAEKNDVKALAQMEEYHSWRGSDYAEGSAGRQREDNLERSFRVRRLALNDPIALEDEIDHLITGAIYWRETDTIDRQRALLKAKDYAKRLPMQIREIDIWDPKRREIEAVKYIDRELQYLQELGDNYHLNRSMHEKQAEDLQKRLDS